jgi:hypothetical protein
MKAELIKIKWEVAQFGRAFGMSFTSVGQHPTFP